MFFDTADYKQKATVGTHSAYLKSVDFGTTDSGLEQLLYTFGFENEDYKDHVLKQTWGGKDEANKQKFVGKLTNTILSNTGLKETFTKVFEKYTSYEGMLKDLPKIAAHIRNNLSHGKNSCTLNFTEQTSQIAEETQFGEFTSKMVKFATLNIIDNKNPFITSRN